MIKNKGLEFTVKKIKFVIVRYQNNKNLGKMSCIPPKAILVRETTKQFNKTKTFLQLSLANEAMVEN